jgi:murein DD-endopeptidase MepM/ murein hydrolase activator NlpD
VPDTPTTSPTTSTPDDPAPGAPGGTTSIPGDPTGAPSDGGGATPEPAPPLPSLPPELAADPRAQQLADPGPEDGGGPPLGQGTWDPRSNVVLRERVTAVRSELARVRRELEAMGGELGVRRGALAEVADRLGRLDAASREQVAAAAAARRELRRHAVDAFVRGRSDLRIVAVRFRDPAELGVARRYLESVAGADAGAVIAAEAAHRRLGAEQASLVAEVDAAAAAVAALDVGIRERTAELAGLADELRAYEAGSHVYVRGFVFPVAGPVDFIDSWGFPRMTGTPSAHWHQGTDVFAAHGTPLVAAESGRLARVGQGTLGGNKLWVVGDSGTEYYYAHLAAFAPGVVDGRRVNAGDVVGYVGDTGNARGTSPHLHFEIHPGGTGPVNPYPLLAATRGAAATQVVVQPAGAAGAAAGG